MANPFSVDDKGMFTETKRETQSTSHFSHQGIVARRFLRVALKPAGSGGQRAAVPSDSVAKCAAVIANQSCRRAPESMRGFSPIPIRRSCNP